MGYKNDFLGHDITITSPTFDINLDNKLFTASGELREIFFSNHVHFSLVFNQDTRQVIYTVCNIDLDKVGQDLSPKTGIKGWTYGPILPLNL